MSVADAEHVDDPGSEPGSGTTGPVTPSCRRTSFTFWMAAGVTSRNLITTDHEGEIIMLKDLEIIAVLPATDIARARNYYRDVLGLEPADAMDEENLMYRCGKGTAFLLYKTGNAGTAKNTQMGWATKNIEAEVQDLRDRGVVFEEYDFPSLKTENGIASTPVGKAAWFLDSEGNILNLLQR